MRFVHTLKRNGEKFKHLVIIEYAYRLTHTQFIEFGKTTYHCDNYLTKGAILKHFRTELLPSLYGSLNFIEIENVHFE